MSCHVHGHVARAIGGSLCGGVWSAPGHHAVHQETPSVLRVVGRLSCRVEHRRKTEPSTPHRRQELELRGVSLSVEAILLNIRPLLQPYTNLFEHLARRGSLVKIHIKSQYRVFHSKQRKGIPYGRPYAYLLTYLLQHNAHAPSPISPRTLDMDMTLFVATWAGMEQRQCG